MAEPIRSTSTIAPKKGPGIMGFLLILGLVVIAGLSLYKFYSTNAVVDTPAAEDEPLTSVDTSIDPPPSIESELEVPEDWRTYSSQLHRFSIKYPEDINVETPQNGFTRFIKLGSTQSEGTELFDGISITIGSQPLNDRTLQQVADNDAGRVEPIGQITESVGPAVVNGLNGYKYRASALGDYTKYFLPIQDSSSYLEITVMAPDPQNLGYEQTVDQMLSTLIILPQESGREWLTTGNIGVLVGNQIAGNTVQIDRVSFEEPGYIVIHDVNQDGRPGSVIGRSNIISNGGENISITLTTVTSQGSSIVIMLHDDDGDREYEYPESDLPIADPNGQPVMKLVQILPSQ